MDVNKRPFGPGQEDLNDEWEKVITEIESEINRLKRSNQDTIEAFKIFIDSFETAPK